VGTVSNFGGAGPKREILEAGPTLLLPCGENIFPTFCGAACDRKIFCHKSGGCRKHTFWTAHVNRLKIIHWRSKVFGPPPKNSLGHSYKILDISSESSAQTQSIGTLFEQIGFRGGVCGHVQKSEAHALGCRPRGESSQ
jgi:hypothetical protein